MTSDDKNKGIGSMDNDDAIDIEEAVSGVGADDDLIDEGDDEMDMDGGEDFSFDVNEKQKSGGGLKKIMAPALVLVAAAGVGGYIVMNPDILTKFMGGTAAPVQQQAMSSPSAFGGPDAGPVSPELPQPAGANGDLPVPETTDIAALPEQPVSPDATQPMTDGQMPRGPEEVLDVTAAAPEGPVAAPDQTALVDTTSPEVWQAPEPEAQPDSQPAPAPTPEVTAEETPAAEPVAVAAAPAPEAMPAPVETPMETNGAELNDAAPSAPGDVPAMPEEMGSADEPAVQTATPAESVPPEMPVATAQPVEVPPAAAQQPAAPAALTPQGTMAQVTPPAAAPGGSSGDAYYDAGINLPRGPIAKETIREVDPSVEPGQKMIIAKKDYNQSSQEALLESASRALKLQRYEAALEMYEQLYAKNKRDRRILMGLAVSQQYAGRTEAAIQTYETLLDIDPKNAGAMVNMLGLLRAQYPEVALRRLMDLQERFPGNAGIAAQIGLTQAELGHYDDAVRYMQMAASLEPRNAQHLFNIAVIADRKGATGDAIKYYEQALEADAVYSGGKSLPRETIYDRLAKLRRN